MLHTPATIKNGLNTKFQPFFLLKSAEINILPFICCLLPLKTTSNYYKLQKDKGYTFLFSRGVQPYFLSCFSICIRCQKIIKRFCRCFSQKQGYFRFLGKIKEKRGYIFNKNRTQRKYEQNKNIYFLHAFKITEYKNFIK